MHSNLSKCQYTIDGSPDANLRFARDILGCQVLTLTDHTHKQGAAEFAWHLDKLEEAAGERNIVLYSSEPGLSSGHHTNFYAIDRQVFERLRLIGISEHDREKVYEKIKREFPEDSVLALRHFHGRCEDRFDSLEAAGTWDPDLEVAMETMQIRGDILMGRIMQDDEAVPPSFPANFLNSGAEIGFIGGSDHANGYLNHFALTGFLVEDFSAEGVWEALKNRRTIACSNGKIAIWAELNGLPMGSKVKVADDVVKIKTIIKGVLNLKRICLLRDGKPIKWLNVQGNGVETILEDNEPMPGRHWYSVTAEGKSAFQDLGRESPETSVLAHSSPFFVDIEK